MLLYALDPDHGAVSVREHQLDGRSGLSLHPQGLHRALPATQERQEGRARVRQEVGSSWSRWFHERRRDVTQ